MCAKTSNHFFLPDVYNQRLLTQRFLLLRLANPFFSALPHKHTEVPDYGLSDQRTLLCLSFNVCVFALSLFPHLPIPGSVPGPKPHRRQQKFTHSCVHLAYLAFSAVYSSEFSVQGMVPFTVKTQLMCLPTIEKVIKTIHKRHLQICFPENSILCQVDIIKNHTLYQAFCNYKPL